MIYFYRIIRQHFENIIYFKRGFGEHSWPQKRWIWFRDKGSELAYLSDRLKTYEQCLNIDN